MLLLLDTSTKHLAIGLADEQGVLLEHFHAEATETERGIHDARLALETEKLLQESNVTAQQISRIGIVIGPGSFTGLRIGLSFAKGFAFACHASIVPLTVHEVMRMVVEFSPEALIVIPGYREDLYYIADSEHPRKIQMINADTLSNIDRPLLLHESLRLRDEPLFSKASVFTAPSLSIMAQLVANDPSPLKEYDSLEPLYLT